VLLQSSGRLLAGEGSRHEPALPLMSGRAWARASRVGELAARPRLSATLPTTCRRPGPPLAVTIDAFAAAMELVGQRRAEIYLWFRGRAAVAHYIFVGFCFGVGLLLVPLALWLMVLLFRLVGRAWRFAPHMFAGCWSLLGWMPARWIVSESGLHGFLGSIAFAAFWVLPILVAAYFVQQVSQRTDMDPAYRAALRQQAIDHARRR
jgi:hypothetical protein